MVAVRLRAAGRAERGATVTQRAFFRGGPAPHRGPHPRPGPAMDASVGRQAVSSRASLPAWTLSGRPQARVSDDSPGPAASPSMSAARPSSPAYSMARRTQAPVEGRLGPGPAAYRLPSSRSARSAKLKGRTMFGDMTQGAKSASTPGPSVVSGPRRHGATGLGFGKASRFGPGSSAASRAPGPGAYTAAYGTIGHGGKGCTLSGRTPMAADRARVSASPGPGAVRPSGTFGQGAGAMSGRSGPSWGFGGAVRFEGAAPRSKRSRRPAGAAGDGGVTGIKPYRLP